MMILDMIMIPVSFVLLLPLLWDLGAPEVKQLASLAMLRRKIGFKAIELELQFL